MLPSTRFVKVLDRNSIRLLQLQGVCIDRGYQSCRDLDLGHEERLSQIEFRISIRVRDFEADCL